MDEVLVGIFMIYYFLVGFEKCAGARHQATVNKGRVRGKVARVAFRGERGICMVARCRNEEYSIGNSGVKLFFSYFFRN